MPIFSDPSLLTTARLKEELTKYGVDFRPNKPKKYYVELYSENIREDDDSQSKLGFSSDEEASVQTPAIQPRASLGGNASSRGGRASPARSPGGALQGVAELSDAELRSELQSFGFEVGPISEISRKMCQRKLLEFLGKERKPSSLPSPARRSAGGSRVLFSDEEAGGGRDDSDDDTASVQTPAIQPRASLGGNASSRGGRASPARSPGGALQGVAELSDAELRSELQSFGFEVGPISEISRKMCQRKLLEFLGKERKPSSLPSPARRSAGGSRVLFSDEEAGGGRDDSDDDTDDDDDDDTDHGPAGTTRAWPRLSEKAAAVPTVAQAGSTPPRSAVQRAGVRDRQRLAQSELSRRSAAADNAGGWPVRTMPAARSPGGGKTSGRDEASAADTDGVDVTDYDDVDRRNLLKRQSAERSGSSLAHFLELLAIGLLGFFIVIVLAFVEGPHHQLIPAMPYFQSQPPADAGP